MVLLLIWRRAEMIFFRERTGAVLLLFCLSVMSAGSCRQDYAQVPEDLPVVFFSSGEVPAAVFPEAEENNKPWLKRPAPRQPGWSHPSENAIAGELKRQIQQLKQKNAGLEKEKLIWQAQKEDDARRIAGLEKMLKEVRQQYEKPQTKSERVKAREQTRVVEEQKKTLRTLMASLAESQQQTASAASANTLSQITRLTERPEAEQEAPASAGEKFYRQYAQKKSVRKLHDTLYDIKESGKGAILMASDQVDILLTGRLPDGTIFDDSGAKNKIQRVRLDSLLPALTEVLTKLRPGGHMEVVLPPSRAFGEEGVPGLIPENATLFFDIKVLKKV
ncbi:hypothetical protein GAA99_22895 [Salmonella enterica]|nr:hypothetical protein [Salmonella enterica]